MPHMGVHIFMNHQMNLQAQSSYGPLTNALTKSAVDSLITMINSYEHTRNIVRLLGGAQQTTQRSGEAEGGALSAR